MASPGGPESGAAVSPGAGGVVPRIGLFGRLGARARVTVVSAPAGSGKTVLLRSWIGEAGVADRAAWVPVGREERDPQLARNLELVERLAAVAERHETTPGAVAIAWTLRNPAVDGAIVGFRRPGQINAIIGGASLELSQDDFATIEGNAEGSAGPGAARP